MTSTRQITIFDTTLRDGEQSPGCSMNLSEKLELAQALVDMGVDIIEAGFPIASPGDFAAVSEISRTIFGATICGLARCSDKDIDRAWEALKHAEKSRIHVFLATSAIHREFKLKMTREEIIRRAVDGVRRAVQYCDDVEFSPEDAARTEHDFLCEVVEAAIEAGALVNLISGPVSIDANKSARLYKINSANEMLEKVDELMPNTDIFISCAAVSDFKPSHYHENKIKKDDLNVVDLELKKNKDILGHVAKVYKSSYIVGFAAETKNVKENARKKLVNKNLNMIISNDVSDKSIGFDSDQNEVNLITKSESIFLKKDKKIRIAREILKIISLNIN